MNEDKIIQRFDRLETEISEVRANLTEFKDKSLTVQDEILTIVRRLDEERVFTARWIEHIEEEITKIKTHLKIN